MPAEVVFDKPTPDHLFKLGAALTVSEGGVIDIDEATGKLVQDFMPNLQRDLGLTYVPAHWDRVKLAAWLCSNLPEPSLTHASKLAFVHDFRPEAYAPSRDDDGQFGPHRFRKHFYSRIGAFDSKEEFECAVWLDTQHTAHSP
jgi:type III restriction enzyme